MMVFNLSTYYFNYLGTLVIADHDNKNVAESIRPVLNAAKKIGTPVTVLVAGENISNVVSQVAGMEGVTKVLSADNAIYAHASAENLAVLVSDIQGKNKYV